MLAKASPVASHARYMNSMVQRFETLDGPDLLINKLILLKHTYIKKTFFGFLSRLLNALLQSLHKVLA